MTPIFMKVLFGHFLQKYIQPARADALLAFVSHEEPSATRKYQKRSPIFFGKKILVAFLSVHCTSCESYF